jgi:hypothetical protein
VLLIGLGIGIWSISRPNREATNHAPPGNPEQALNPNQLPSGVVPFEVKVARGGGLVDLTAAAPVNPATDRYQVIGRVPEGHDALLLHVTPDRGVRRLDTRASPADRYTTHYYPPNGGSERFESGKPGTEVLILLAGANLFAPEKKDELDEVIGLARRHLSRLERMEPREFVRLTRDEPTRGINYDSPEGSEQVQLQLDKFRQVVRGKNLSVIQGIAFTR